VIKSKLVKLMVFITLEVLILIVMAIVLVEYF